MALLLGLVALFVAGGLQTVWAPPESLAATVPAGTEEAPLTVITEGIGEVDEDPVEFTLTGEGYFNVMLGRARDVEAWVGDAAHNTVTGVDTGADRGEAPRIEVEHAEGEATVPNPRDSDLWLDVQVGRDRLEQRWTVPSEGEWALLVARDGTDPAPTDLTVTWTNRAGDSPWIVPLYVLGGLLVAAGIALLAWALLRRRRGGPGAGGRPGGAVRTGTVAHAAGRSSAAGAARGSGTTAVRSARGIGAGLAVLALGVAGTVPAGAQGPAATDGAVDAPADAQEEAYPVLVDSQLERILGDVAKTVAAGDEKRDAKVLKPRVGGTALQMRDLNYRNRDIDEERNAPAPIAASPVLSAVAVSDPAFPRTAMAVTEGKGNDTPQVLVLRQESARQQYRLVDTVPMTPGAELPGGTLEQAGVATLDPADAAGLVMSPADAMAGTARYLNVPEHDFSERIAPNPYAKAVHDYQREQVESADDARLRFERTEVQDSVTALRLADGSALVVGALDADTLASPRERGGSVIVDDLVAEVGGGDRETGGGVRMTYREVVALHVPADGTRGNESKVSLVGVADELRSVEFLD
ncbi:hypothetical protein E7744_09730 [Citricoccus sp. SGAir0253]|uniref:hypothetical protein n=1 Tax=Citricoccus sp. SGAir0253 TaxID=2567881 RepID=UPI0010CCEA31|nr:hypothetical protein [Citricoccus sp. SGAir0253]QCU78405.1 hypothetical protein E7744_09730 [Citricoccus sp. SGAir0253]